MRILSLGVPLPNAQVDNFNWASALSFFDYDALVIDPVDAVSNFIEITIKDGGYVTYTEQPVEDGQTSADSIGLADMLRRRQREVAQLLARGGIVVVIAQPDMPHPRVSGFTGCHRYYWLPAPEGLDYGPSYLEAANGTSFSVSEFGHPFAELLERIHGNVLYRAAFTDVEDGFVGRGKVLGRSPGGAVVALEVQVGAGKVVFLPALPLNPSTAERMSMANALVGAIRNTLLLGAEGSPPAWLKDYSLPGIDDAQAEVKSATDTADAAEAALDEARNAYRTLDVHRRILWQEGKYGFDLPVRDALSLLGLASIRSQDDPAAYFHDGETLFVETESAKTAVGLSPHYRMRERLETKIVMDGQRVRGLIVVNGYREQDPATRPQQYEPSLQLAAEQMNYGILLASDLFAAVKDKLLGVNDGSAFASALLEARGLFKPPVSITTATSDVSAKEQD